MPMPMYMGHVAMRRWSGQQKVRQMDSMHDPINGSRAQRAVGYDELLQAAESIWVVCHCCDKWHPA